MDFLPSFLGPVLGMTQLGRRHRRRRRTRSEDDEGLLLDDSEERKSPSFQCYSRPLIQRRPRRHIVYGALVRFRSNNKPPRRRDDLHHQKQKQTSSPLWMTASNLCEIMHVKTR